MKLTIQELDLIDCYLEQRKVDYLDFKIELKDHLACETEKSMENEKLTFEDAFAKVQNKWSYDLAEAKFTWIFNNKRTYPKIVFKKIRNRYIVFFSLTLVFAFLVGSFPPYFEMLTTYISPYNSVIKYVIVFISFISLLGFLKLNVLHKNKTSYSGMFNQILYSSISFIALIFIIDDLFLMGIYFVLYSFPFLIYYYFKHQQFVKKYDLI